MKCKRLGNSEIRRKSVFGLRRDERDATAERLWYVPDTISKHQIIALSAENNYLKLKKNTNNVL